MPRSTTSHGRRPVMSSPLNTMRPRSGRKILVIRRSRVVLPAPFGPMRPTISSRASAKLTLLTAVSPPKRLVSPSTAKNGVVISLEYRVDEKSIDQTSAELTGWPQPLARLREALEKDEFTLYCQPIAALRAGGERFAMAEVLVRMREEERALLPPGEFLPVFEHYGMMPQLDRWVLQHTVQQLARGSRFARFTINVSGQTLRDAAFPGFAAALRAYGGGVLIDSFCRRAVSFAPFKALRPAFVKVDGSVIRKLGASEAAQTKLKAVVRVAEALGMGVVAECVEQQELLERLRALDVGYAQGFSVFQPAPIERVAAKA